MCKFKVTRMILGVQRSMDDVGCATKYGSLMFGSLHKVIKDVHEGHLKQGKKVHKSYRECLQRGTPQQHIVINREKVLIRALDEVLVQAPNTKANLIFLIVTILGGKLSIFLRVYSSNLIRGLYMDLNHH